MGDVCSLSILAFISQALHEHANTKLLIGLLCTLLLISPVLGYFARQNKFTKSVILTGWTAILGAVVVEQPGGMVMEASFRHYKAMSTFQPLVNGKWSLRKSKSQCIYE